MKKQILALLLSLTLCVSLLPAAFAAEEKAPKTYDQAVAELRSGMGHSNEKTFETDECTVFSYNRGGFMYAPLGALTIIYKAGSAMGEGTVIDLPHITSRHLYQGAPTTLALSEDKKTFTYTYFFLEAVGNPNPPPGVTYRTYMAPGTYSFSVDLATGTVTESYASLDYATALDQLTRVEGYIIDEQLETPYSTVVTRHKAKTWWVAEAWDDLPYNDYEMYLVLKEMEGENTVQRLLLPSTAYNKGYAYAPTDRLPDSTTLDDKAFVYTYSFDAPLTNGDTVYHEAGTYTYTVNTATGEQSVIHSDEVKTPAQPSQPAEPSQSGSFADVPAGSWFEKGVTTCAEKEVMVGTGEGRFSPDSQLTAAECLTMALRLYDLRRGGSGAVLQKAPEDWGKYTLTLSDGTVFTRWGEQTSSFHSGHFDPYNDGWGVHAVTVVAPGDTAEEQLAWAKAHEGPAVFTAEGKSYSGAVAVEPDGYDGPELRFGCEEEPNAGGLLSNCKPGPDRWYRDTVYTVEQLGLGEADGFSSLLGSLCYDSPDRATARRESFAKALAVAAGELEKKYDVTVPDVERTEYSENIYRLYEAGILNGLDAFGTFQGDKRLTRAECAVMVARVLDPDQRLTTPPAAPEAAYDQKLIDLRRGFGYHNERLFDTDICTVVVRDYGGMMHAQKGCITVIYKPGSAKGDGFTVSPPHPGNNYSPLLSRNPDHMELSEDKKTFTYSYHFDEPLVGSGRINRAAGDFIYTVDLATGEVTENVPTVDESVNTYAACLERALADYAERGYVVEQTIEAPLCSLIFHYFPAEDGTRSYFLALVYKTDVDAEVSGSIWHTSEGTVKPIGLPIISNDGDGVFGQPVYYTSRMPDSMALSEDGNTFTLTYNECHYGSPYTQVIDLKTGLYESK